MPRAAGDPQAVLNEFLRLYLEDRERGAERSVDDYRALFPDHGELISRELAALQGEVREGGRASHRDEPSTDVPRAAGKRFGPYVLVRPLGQGGQGLVWLARDSRLDRPVALKLLTQLAALSSQALERFHREAQVASRLDDPGICAIYETGSEHGVHYIAMRHVEGESLATLLDRARAQEQGPRFPALPADPDESSAEVVAGSSGFERLVPPSSAPPGNAAEAIERAVRLFERLARSLHRAHEAGVVHRDVKPGNVMVACNGHPVLLDFGLAGVLDESLPSFTRTGDVFGTPAYMAPEQIAPEQGSEQRVDRRSDVYALGATLYECLTLRHPFESVSREGLYQAIREQDPSDPRRTNPAIPADLWTILQTCLAKERARRYQSALELAEDLRRFREGKPIRAHPPSRVYLARRFVRRYRVLVTSTLVVFATLCVAVVVSLGLMVEAREQRRAAEANARAERRVAYAAQMSQALAAHEKGYLLRAAQLLDAWKPDADEEDLRGFEWYALWKLLHAGLEAGYPGKGTLLVALTLTADGTRFRSLDAHGVLREVRLADGEVVLERDLGTKIGERGGAFSRGGERVAAFHWYTEYGPPLLRAWSADTNELLFARELAPRSVNALALSASGRLFAWGGGQAGSGDTLTVWDMEKDEERFRLDALVDAPSALEFSPDETRLAVGGHDGSVRSLDALTGAELVRLAGHRTEIMNLDFSPDGRRLVSTAEWTPRVWDLVTFQELRPLIGHQGTARALAFAPDGERIGSGGASDGTVRIWDGDRSTVIAAHTGGRFAWCADGRSVLVSEADGAVRRWSAQPATHPVELARPMEYDHTPRVIWDEGVCLAFLSDGTLVSAGEDGHLQLWDPEERRERASWSAGEALTALAVSPADGALFVGTGAGKVLAFEGPELRTTRTIQVHDGRVRSLALSPDGTKLASGGQDGLVSVRARSALEPAVARKELGAALYSLAFCDGARTLAVGGAGLCRFWDADANGERQVPAPLGNGGYFALLPSPDGLTLASVTSGWTPQTWDARTLAGLHPLNGHAGGSYKAIAFAPDGKTIATGSVDKSVKLWQTSTGLELLTLPHPDHVHSLAFSPDGRWLATWCCDGKLRLWPAASPAEVARLAGS